MNFYKHHIGDYDADTAHLSMLEDAAYSRLMRAYYRTERPIPADIKAACRLVRATTKQEREAVSVVLHEFFTLEDDGWHNKRCDEEVTAYLKQSETNRAIAVARELKRKRNESCNGSSGFREPSQNPESNNQITPTSTPAASPPNADAFADPIFGFALDLLTSKGVTETRARGFLGRVRQLHGDELVLRACETAQREDASEPIAFIVGRLKATERSRSKVAGAVALLEEFKDEIRSAA